MSSLPIRQVAYFCVDVRAAAAHHATFGSGTLFVADNIPVAPCVHHGVERVLDHSSAYGQWGEVMIEFVQHKNAGPSLFDDIYPEGSGGYGLHHVAVFVEDVNAALADFAETRNP